MNRILNLIFFPDDHPHFLRYATDLANVLRNTIFVDQVHGLCLICFEKKFNLGLDRLSRFKEARNTTALRGAYH